MEVHIYQIPVYILQINECAVSLNHFTLFQNTALTVPSHTSRTVHQSGVPPRWTAMVPTVARGNQADVTAAPQKSTSEVMYMHNNCYIENTHSTLPNLLIRSELTDKELLKLAIIFVSISLKNCFIIQCFLININYEKCCKTNLKLKLQ